MLFGPGGKQATVLEEFIRDVRAFYFDCLLERKTLCASDWGFGVSSGILAAVDEHSGRSRSCSGPKRWSDCAVVSSGVVEFVVSDDKATTSTAIQAPRSPKADIHFPPTMIIVILWSGCSPK